jgi:hypothetical protein
MDSLKTTICVYVVTVALVYVAVLQHLDIILRVIVLCVQLSRIVEIIMV